jgi:hypothetical protein
LNIIYKPEKMKSIFPVLFICFGLSQLLVFSGCSVVGLVIGSAVDSKDKGIGYSPDDLLKIPTKSEVELILRNGESRRGQYVFYTFSTEEDNKLASITCYEASTQGYFVTPLADINTIYVKQKQTGWAWGLGIGAGLDAIIGFSLRGSGSVGGSWYKFDEE